MSSLCVLAAKETFTHCSFFFCPEIGTAAAVVVNEIIAERIIALAEKGERDPRMLANAALSPFGFDRA